MVKSSCYQIQAEYRTDVNTKKAEADLAYELQASKQQQLIVSEKLNVDLGKKETFL